MGDRGPREPVGPLSRRGGESRLGPLDPDAVRGVNSRLEERSAGDWESGLEGREGLRILRTPFPLALLTGSPGGNAGRTPSGSKLTRSSRFFLGRAGEIFATSLE